MKSSFIRFKGVFVRATEAAASIAIQRALAAHDWPENVSVRARIALHTGEPQLSAEGYIGLDVHHTARIMNVGHAGQILLSQTTYNLMEHALPDDTFLKDLGEHRLKDLQRSVHLFQLSSANLPMFHVPYHMIGQEQIFRLAGPHMRRASAARSTGSGIFMATTEKRISSWNEP